MPNDYFSFKQFTVQQGKSAMKVCTDACLFGAFVADKIQQQNDIENILDIGTGTGLLSLMLAQKNNAHIDAVEIDAAAYDQAKDNFSKSPWTQRLTAHPVDVNEFTFKQQYDVIISNPPFFNQSLQSDDERKNMAKHTGLSFEQLVSLVSSNLKENGSFFVLLPYAIFPFFEKCANAYNLFLNEQLHVKQTTEHYYFRTIGIFSKEQTKEAVTGSLTIKENDQYNPQFALLLKDYYL